MTMSATDFLAHYGVKGMKWGTRHDKGHEGESVKTKKLAKLDKKWAKQFQGVSGFVKMNNAVADRMNGPNGGIAKVNNKPQYQGVNMFDPKNSRLADRYYKEIGDQTHSAFVSAAKDFGMNPSGTQRIGVSVDRQSNSVNFVMEDIQHADGEQPLFTGQLNTKGQIVSIDKLEAGSSDEDSFVEQSDAAVDFLAHYGVKGMKWGQSKADRAAGKEAPSEDAQRVGQIHSRVKANKSTRPLSNKELQDAITRMNLEQQYSRMTGGLDKTRRQKASAFIKDTVEGLVKGTVKDQATYQVKDAMEKKTQTGRYDPVTVAKREADLASANARARQANAS